MRRGASLAAKVSEFEGGSRSPLDAFEEGNRDVDPMWPTPRVRARCRRSVQGAGGTVIGPQGAASSS